MNIVTTYFLVKRIPGSIFIGDTTLKHSAARQEEYLDCIRRNVAHPEVSSLHLLIEGRDAYQHFRQHVLSRSDFFDTPAMRNKIVPVLRGGGQPTYADLFRHADQMLRGKLAMVCNADVYLPGAKFSVRELQKLFDMENTYSPGRIAVALTRHESEDPNDAILVDDYRGSHDAFIVRPPLLSPVIENVRHPQNGYKAENVVLFELQRNGYRVVNPCRSLMLVHRHAADLRQWLPPVDENRYAQAKPCTLCEAIEMIRNDRQTFCSEKGGRV